MSSEGSSNDIFKEQWKSLQMQDVLSDRSKPTSDADVLRSIIAQVEFARASNILDNEGERWITKDCYQKYAEVIDTPEENGGVDNYADVVLPQIEGKRNESQQWKCGLTLDNVDKWKCVQDLRKVSQVARNHVIPPGKENIQILLKSESPRKKACNLSVSSRQSNYKSTLQPPKEAESSTNQEGLGYNKHILKAQNDRLHSGKHVNDNGNHHLQGPLQESRNEFHQQQTRNINKCEPLFPSASSKISTSGANNETNSFWNMGHRSTHITNPSIFDSGDMNSRHNFQEFSWKQTQREEIPERQPVSSFKTAREQLQINDQKKFGRSRSDPQGSINSATYGTSKKSLGTRRGLNSKFVPPVMNRDNAEDDGGTLVRKAGGNKALSGGENGEPIDERLKNIEQKMVELIMSEIMDHGPPISWDDIAGLDFAKKTIKEIVVWPMLRPDIFTGLRGPPKGLLLFGPPGTGKTLIGKCIASQSKSTFFSISASSLTSKWVGEGEKMVRALFAVARVHQPAVVFMDEIDSLLSQRSDNEHESSRRIKTEFLVQLDGATSGETDRILIVGATNRPQEIDEAARRRFVKRLYIPLPEDVARRQIVENLMSQQKHHLEEHEMAQIMLRSKGYSGSDMANLCREAALGPIRSVPFEEIEHITAEQVRPIMYADFEAAFTQVRASVSDSDLDLYIKWNKQYGSWET